MAEIIQSSELRKKSRVHVIINKNTIRPFFMGFIKIKGTNPPITMIMKKLN